MYVPPVLWKNKMAVTCAPMFTLLLSRGRVKAWLKWQ
jgi:hypothetical protein